jgi:hypothetical protein
MRVSLQTKITLLIVALIGDLVSWSSTASTTYLAHPADITVTMYALFPGGAQRDIECAYGSKDWGCTALCDNEINGQDDPVYNLVCTQRDLATAYIYPGNELTIPIESDYLLDVLPQEMSPIAYHPAALRAQAIAARSYAYWHINAGRHIYNSTNSQVFIPFKFESLPPVTFPNDENDPCASTNLNHSQQKVCDAVAPAHHVSYDEQPAFTEFFADVRTRTLTNTTDIDSDGELDYPYLRGVADPISWEPTILDEGHGHGMSQKGASRWGWGNSGYQGNLTPWSVQWQHAEQILVHYYTGIHLWDANDTQLTDGYRWNLLSLDWHTADNQPPVMQPGGAYAATLQVQNTNVYDWPAPEDYTALLLSYHWAKPGFESKYNNNNNEAPVAASVSQGDTYTFTLDIDDLPDWGPCAYELQLDMAVTADGYYWFSETYNWPTYDVTLNAEEPCWRLFLPLLQHR